MYELEPLISNLHRKDRNSWEQARMIAYVIAQCNSTKKLKPTDIMQFTWDSDTTGETSTVSYTHLTLPTTERV